MENNTNDSLGRVFREAYGSEYSAFYRDVYAKRGFVVPEGWRPTKQQWFTIPTISKDDLTQYGYDKRAFRSLDELEWVYTSSGTSKRPVVLNLRNRIFEYDGPKAQARRIMFFRTSLLFFVYAKAGIASVSGDLNYPEATVQLAEEFQIDAIGASISQLRVFTAALRETFDKRNIKLIVLGGERCTEDGFRFIREHYPNALTVAQYGTSETHGMHAHSCEELARLGTDYVHFREQSAFPELIRGAHDDVIEDTGEEGELVLTVLWEKNMFPVIRFRTGDLARRVAPLCGCKEDTYELLGRTEFDRALIPGGQLKSEELERVLAPYRDSIHEDFELHVFLPTGSVRLPRLELLVRSRRQGINLSQLAEVVSKEMRVGPERTIASGVEDGLYLPLACQELPVGKPSAGKRKRILTHE